MTKSAIRCMILPLLGAIHAELSLLNNEAFMVLTSSILDYFPILHRPLRPILLMQSHSDSAR